MDPTSKNDFVFGCQTSQNGIQMPLILK